MNYPTREQAQTILECGSHDCKECENAGAFEYCATDIDDPDKLGTVFLAFHDALDAKQERIDELSKLLHIEANANNKANDNLTKAHDLIRRIVVESYETYGSDEFDALIDEAEAMTRENITLDPKLYAPEYIAKVESGEICRRCGDSVEEGEPPGYQRYCDVCQENERRK